jgi:hypothetical protein
MAETEVESILREIRERVISGQRLEKEVTAASSTIANGSNGSGESEPFPELTDDNETLLAANLTLINSYLTTTARAWDRLPPLLSNRSGLIARMELWLKRQLKRATHWFTWEQVNFNAAVDHALRDLLTVLSAQENELGRLRSQIAQLQQEIARLTEIRTELDRHRTELDEQRTEFDTERDLTGTRIAGLVNELRDRDAQWRDEQRVCFKQLALETSEAAVLEDRARRKTEALLEELQRRVEQMENKS